MACSFFKTHNMRGIYFWGIWYYNGADAALTTPGPGLTQEIQPESVAVINGLLHRVVAIALTRIASQRIPLMQLDPSCHGYTNVRGCAVRRA